MFDLTPAERRGALVLLALVVLGAVGDLWRREPHPAPEPPPIPVAAPGPGAAPAAASPASPPVDLNGAGEAELDRLPGIGPVLAARIVAHRASHGPFHAPEDLLAVPGIGPKLLERLGSRVVARPPAPAPRETVQIARTRGK